MSIKDDAETKGLNALTERVEKLPQAALTGTLNLAATVYAQNTLGWHSTYWNPDPRRLEIRDARAEAAARLWRAVAARLDHAPRVLATQVGGTLRAPHAHAHRL